jgi:pyruvate/2-oxoglutarate dehydrogenase complex dihydrolipoamide acyltransferase (E2) component
MATSAQTLSMIIDELLKTKPANRDEALKHLDSKGYLPKKLLEKPKTVKPPSIFASKAAEDFAEANGITIPEGFKGTSGKDKISVSDLKKLKDPPKSKINGSPSALKFARDNGIDIDGLVGSGADGKIMLKDVKALKPEEPKEPETPEEPKTPEKKGKKVSPSVAKAMKKYGIDEQDIEDIEPSGKNGELLLKDIKEIIELFEKAPDSDSDPSDESDEDN